ncbi:hypothetical protein ACB092_05G270100 [Castanea dentata]
MSSVTLKVFNSWVFLETRRLKASFPEHVRKFWTDWELRVLVLVSLTLQLSLLHFGSRRRYSAKTWLRVFLWLAYLGADSVATVALGVISKNKRNQNSCDSNDSQVQNELMAFWAPFLLLHLGGQDTITAYAVQDTELWLRHLLGLVVQSGVALYILFLSWKVSWLSFLTIPMFLAGFIKYAERTLVLKSANNPISLLNIGVPDPRGIFTPTDPSMYSLDEHPVVSHHESNTGAEIRDAFILFKKFRYLFLNMKFHIFISHSGYYSYFPNSHTAWKTIEDELGYAYDAYYTKAPLFFTAWGFLFRLFSFTSIIFVFVLFLVKERHKHPQIDLIITYLLLVGAVLIEIYAVILLCASDWPVFAYDPRRDTNGWFIKHITHMRNGFAKLTSRQRWSNSMGQLNLLGLCLKDKSLQNGQGTPKLFAILRKWPFYQMLPRLYRELEMLFHRTDKQVSTELKALVFNTFWEKLRSNSNGFSEEYDKYITNGTVNVETYQSIIIWHIATDLCFYKDSDRNEPNFSREVSKDVSDYMMYILAMCPLAFSAGNVKHGFEFTCLRVENHVNLRKLSGLPKDQVCEKIISEYKANDFEGEKDLYGESLFPLAIQLAKELNQKDGKWEILSKFWVENLACVATLCQGNNHAQLLRKGGEFLTHVWLLIEHFNLTESFQKSRTRPQKEEAKVSPGSESSGSATGSMNLVVDRVLVISSR